LGITLSKKVFWGVFLVPSLTVDFVSLGHVIGDKGRTSVELGESKTDETISISILNEGLGDSVGELNGLVFDSDATDVDNISADGACST
jgi:hypothetical protein